MSLTEDEARTKWCPMVRVQVYDPNEGRNPPVNRISLNDEPKKINCIASECMMWRKSGAKCKDRQGRLVDRDLDGTGKWQDVGYCGLAGKP